MPRANATLSRARIIFMPGCPPVQARPNDTAQQPAHAGGGAEARRTVIRVAGLRQWLVRPIRPRNTDAIATRHRTTAGAPLPPTPPDRTARPRSPRERTEGLLPGTLA